MLKAPFPWFGGKSKAATQIWARLGSDCKNYVEPFLGSGAVWLGRPKDYRGLCTMNDADGLLVNFWRAVRLHPDATAEAACQPVFEADKHARHLALVNKKPALIDRLCADPDHCDPVLAGWWAWGACVWIGSEWCSGNGPWQAVDGPDGVPVFAKCDGVGGVNRKLPHLNGPQGVNRGTGDCAERLEFVRNWFLELQDAFRPARVACGDWERICSVGTMTKKGRCAVVMDPPYSQTGAVYAHDSNTIANDVREWCIANGGNPLLRIALCGHVGEHEAIEAHGWTCEKWDAKKGGGYTGKADDRERIWFSPHCLKRDSGLFL